MSFINWSFITDFGDFAVTVPIALAVAAWLLASHAWRGAALWFLLFGAGACRCSAQRSLMPGGISAYPRSISPASAVHFNLRVHRRRLFSGQQFSQTCRKFWRMSGLFCGRRHRRFAGDLGRSFPVRSQSRMHAGSCDIRGGNRNHSPALADCRGSTRFRLHDRDVDVHIARAKGAFRAPGNKGGPFPFRSIHAVCARSPLKDLSRRRLPSSRHSLQA